MKRFFRFFIFFLLFVVGGIAPSFAADKPTMMFFYGETCPHCKTQRKCINEMQEEFEFEIESHEVYYNEENQELFRAMEKKFNTTFTGVPVVILGDEYVIGNDKAKLEQLVEKYCTSKNSTAILLPGDQETEQNNTGHITQETLPTSISGDDVPRPNTGTFTGKNTAENEKNKVGFDKNLNKENEGNTLKIFGKTVSLEETGPFVFGTLLGLVDGINPCMFGVLIFLLTYLISIGSKKRMLISGLIFVITTFFIYTGIMYGMHKLLFSVSFLLPYIKYIKIGIGVLAIILGLLELKDIFWYGKGISLAIPKKAKPMLEYITVRGTYMSAFVLAILSSLVELPCTIGIPLAYVGAIGEQTNVLPALLVYNLFFILPLIIIIGGIYVGNKAFTGGGEQTPLWKKKVMRGVAGTILLTIGILFCIGKL